LELADEVVYAIARTEDVIRRDFSHKCRPRAKSDRLENPPQVCPLHGHFMLNILIAAILMFAQDEMITGLLPPSCTV
jgi:hypothetical protein